jgi:hypothetical protein
MATRNLCKIGNMRPPSWRDPAGGGRLVVAAERAPIASRNLRKTGNIRGYGAAA